MFGVKIATLTFTDTAIKAVLARPTSKGFKISFLGKKSLPASTVFNGRIINENIFQEALKTFYLENYEKLKTRDIVLGLNEPEVFVNHIKFDEKPKDPTKEIIAKLSLLLPFDLNAAKIVYNKVSEKNYQITTAKTATLSQLSRIVRDAGLSLVAIVPLPIIFPRLIGSQKTPYLFISSEEDLVFSLVVDNIVVFSSTYTLRNQLAESEKEVLLAVSEIIELEYKKYVQEPLKNVFVYGKGAEFLKSFLNAKDFNTQIILDSGESSKQTGYDFADYSRAIALSYYDREVLSFPKFETSKNISSTSKPPKRGRFNPLYLILPLIALVLAVGILLWPNFKEAFLSPSKDGGIPISKETTASSQTQKEATDEARKKAIVPSPESRKEPNRRDFSIRILNGSGIAGAAGKMRDFLSAKGYPIESVGNAENFSYQTITVQIKTSKKGISGLLTKDLEERYSINIGSSISEDEKFDILLIVGGE